MVQLLSSSQLMGMWCGFDSNHSSTQTRGYLCDEKHVKITGCLIPSQFSHIHVSLWRIFLLHLFSLLYISLCKAIWFHLIRWSVKGLGAEGRGKAKGRGLCWVFCPCGNVLKEKEKVGLWCICWLKLISLEVLLRWGCRLCIWCFTSRRFSAIQEVFCASFCFLPMLCIYKGFV